MNQPDYVILLHGLGRSRFSMSRIEAILKQQGFLTHNCGYPSTRYPVEVLAERYLADAIQQCRQQGATTIHIVTHSLGGILIRYYLQHQPVSEIGRIVMLSPPNRGSEIADRLKDCRIYQWILGPVGQQLGTGHDSLPNRLTGLGHEVGIITGNRTSDPWFAHFFDGENDGKVSVESARLPSMSDFLVVPKGHTVITYSSEVIEQVVYFLYHGKFDHSDR